MILASGLTLEGCKARRLRLWTFWLFTAPAAPLRRLHSSSSAFALARRRTMIEVPPDFLNIVFALLIVLASVNRSKQRSAGERAFGL